MRDHFNADPRALAVARRVREKENPLVTILFGSRARGDHDDQPSDINILLIREEEMPLQQCLASRWDARALAQQEYGRTVSVPLVVFTPELF